MQIFDLDRVKESLSSWQKSLQRLSLEREDIAHALDCEINDVSENSEGLEALLADLERIPPLIGNEFLDRLPILRGEVLEKTQLYLKLFVDIQELYISLAEKIGPEVLKDLTIVDQLRSGSDQLKRLVGQSVEFGDLAEAINRLTAVHEQLEQLNEPVKEMQGALAGRVPLDR